MSDGSGIFQHAIFNVPNSHEGYCLDANARAYILCNLLDENGDRPSTKLLGTLAACYLAFIAASLKDAGSEDSHARGLWAAGVGAGRSRDEGHSRLCAQLFERGLPVVESFTSPRARAFTLLGINDCLLRFPDHLAMNTMRKTLTKKLVELWKNCATENWPWFESSLLMTMRSSVRLSFSAASRRRIKRL